jgi:hypothetical protein
MPFASGHVLSNGDDPAIRIPDVQQVRSPAARRARAVNEHALSLRNDLEVASTENDLERQVLLTVRRLPEEHVRATAIDWREDAIVLMNPQPSSRRNPSASQNARLPSQSRVSTYR